MMECHLRSSPSSRECHLGNSLCHLGSSPLGGECHLRSSHLRRVWLRFDMILRCHYHILTGKRDRGEGVKGRGRGRRGREGGKKRGREEGREGERE